MGVVYRVRDEQLERDVALIVLPPEALADVSHAYVTLGDKKRAFEWLERGRDERADCRVWLLSEPYMDPIRGDRRYTELLDQIGLATGKPGRKP